MANARKTDPETSHEAAKSVSNTALVKKAILMILDLGPKSDEEILTYYTVASEGTGFPNATEQSLRSRRNELVREGLVAFTGEFGKTSNNRRTRLWARA